MGSRKIAPANSDADKNRVAAKGAHAMPLLALAVGAAVAGAYLLVGDTLYLLLAGVAAYLVFSTTLVKHGQRHTVMPTCPRCMKFQDKGHGKALASRFLMWYFHRRIIDNKAALLILAAGIVATVYFDALGKRHAVLPFVVTYELFMMQFALFLRSMVIHRGNESSCRLCAAGDEPHPYGRVSASELQD